MTATDTTAVAGLDFTIAHRPWTAEMFLEEINLGSYCRVIVEKSGTIVGYAVARLLFDEWHLMTIGVTPAQRRLGWAAWLLGDLIQKAALTRSQAVLLEVRVSNQPAIQLYKKMNFKALSIRKHYYRGPYGPEDAAIMARLIQAEDAL